VRETRPNESCEGWIVTRATSDYNRDVTRFRALTPYNSPRNLLHYAAIGSDETFD
jgi:hypothetical protein